MFFPALKSSEKWDQNILTSQLQNKTVALAKGVSWRSIYNDITIDPIFHVWIILSCDSLAGLSIPLHLWHDLFLTLALHDICMCSVLVFLVMMNLRTKSSTDNPLTNANACDLQIFERTCKIRINLWIAGSWHEERVPWAGSPASSNIIIAGVSLCFT